MSYPRPRSPLDRPEMSHLHSGCPPGYEQASQQPVGGVDWPIQRSFSTPDPYQGQPPPDQLYSGAAGEKKRNKLGYHRTSVACNHCRRRKIRCIPCVTDIQGRCSNCIRLKKDCSFIPTEQQQTQVADSRLGRAHAIVDPRNVSHPSSPVPHVGNGILRPLHQQIPGSAAHVSHIPPPLNGASDGSGVLASGQPYQSHQNVPGWMPTSIDPFLETSGPPQWNDPWRGRPIQPPMSEHSAAPPLPSAWATGSATSESRDDLGWGSGPAPPRSLSYSGESLGSHTPAHLASGSQPVPPGRQSPATYASAPMSIATVTGSYQQGATPGNTASPGEMSNRAPMQWQQQPPAPAPAEHSLPRPQAGYGNWPYGQRSEGSQAPSEEPEQIATASDSSPGKMANVQ